MTAGDTLDRFDWEFIRADLERRDRSIIWATYTAGVGQDQTCKIQMPLKVKTEAQ